VLEWQFADLVEGQPELLAHHLTAGGNVERAVTQWLKAGRHAAARSANRRRPDISTGVLDCCPALSDPQERDRCEIEAAAGQGRFATCRDESATPTW
jgi:hypothetical protein